MTVEQRIYTTAKTGTPVNPGLPDPLAAYVVAQAKHETGNFTSNFFRNYNNAFGYSYVAGGRYQTGAGTVADNGQRIAAYGSVEDSTRELIDWIYRRRAEGKFPQDLASIQSTDRYAELLKSAGYFGDTLTNYARGLALWFGQLGQNLYQGAAQNPGLLIGLALLIGWVVYKKGKL